MLDKKSNTRFGQKKHIDWLT